MKKNKYRKKKITKKRKPQKKAKRSFKRVKIRKMSKHGYSEAYCLDSNGRFLGKCKLSEIVHAKKKDLATIHLEGGSISIKLDASILQAIEVASDFVGESIPVISRSDGKLAGVVTEADIFQAYMSTQVRINDLERS